MSTLTFFCYYLDNKMDATYVEQMETALKDIFKPLGYNFQREDFLSNFRKIIRKYFINNLCDENAELPFELFIETLENKLEVIPKNFWEVYSQEFIDSLSDDDIILNIEGCLLDLDTDTLSEHEKFSIKAELEFWKNILSKERGELND